MENGFRGRIKKFALWEQALIFEYYMRIHLIKEKTVEDFVAKHAAGKNSFMLWLSVVKVADWHIPEDILASFGSADLLAMEARE